MIDNQDNIDNLASVSGFEYRITSYERWNPRHVFELDFAEDKITAETKFKDLCEDDFNAQYGVDLTLEIAQSVNGKYIPIRIATFVCVK